MTGANLRDPQVDGLIFSLIVIALLPAFNVVAQELLLASPTHGIGSPRTIFSTGIAAVLVIGWIFWRPKLRALARSLYPRGRIGALSFVLVAAYLSQIFFGFWHPGVAGWTYENYGLERIEAKAENFEDSQNVPENHRTVIEGSFRHDFAAQQGLSEDVFCWDQGQIVVDFAPADSYRDQLTTATVLSSDSLGFVFPDYIVRRLVLEPDGLTRLVNARIRGGQIPIPWDTIGHAINLPTWHYWSHSPTIEGMFDYSKVTTATSAQFYRVMSCVENGKVTITSISRVGPK